MKELIRWILSLLFGDGKKRELINISPYKRNQPCGPGFRDRKVRPVRGHRRGK